MGNVFLSDNIKTVFFCGIGGASMLSLAIFARKQGYAVQGSDCSPTEQTVRACRKNHIPLFFSHNENNICGCDAFVYTAAISTDNPELLCARKSGLEIFTRSRFLGAMVGTFSHSIGISGTHGKSTVTNMLYSVFCACGVRPTLFSGADAVNHKALMIGSDDTVIFEACEYNRSFLDMKPTQAIILNIEREHIDIFPKIEDSEDAFFEFASDSSRVILNAESASCLSVAKRLDAIGKKADYFTLNRTRNSFFAENLRESKGYYTFDIGYGSDILLKDVTLSVFGIHNVSNALAAFTAAYTGGLRDIAAMKRGLEEFNGLKRRFEYIGNVGGADVFDDYAHHPTEIRTTLESAQRLGYSKIIVAFQPHTYSRTYAFFEDFKTAFEGCDEVILTDIYPAREKNIHGVFSSDLAKEIKGGKYIKNFSDIVSYLRIQAHPKTLILTMGAGKLNEVASELCNKK